MLDPVTPPAVVEGEIDGGVDAVLLIAADSLVAAIASNTAASLPLLWITAIAPRRMAETRLVPDAGVLASRRRIRRPILNRFRNATTRRRASLPSSTTCSSPPRFKKPR